MQHELVFPTIPVELTWCILEILALDVPDKATELVLLSKAVQKVYGGCPSCSDGLTSSSSIDPILYSAFIIEDQSCIPLLARTIRTGSKPEEFYRKHTRILCVTPIISHCETDWDDLRDIIVACTGLTTFMMWDSDYTGIGPNSDDPLASWFISHGSGHFSRLCQVSLWLRFDARILNALAQSSSCITHLDLLLSTRDELMEPAALFNLFPELTHLMLFSLDVNLNATVSLLRSHLPPSIRLCVVSFDTIVLKNASNDWIMHYIQDPSPIVLGIRTCLQDTDTLNQLGHFPLHYLVDHVHDNAKLSKEWGPQERGAGSIWKKAEEILALKRSTVLSMNEAHAIADLMTP